MLFSTVVEFIQVPSIRPLIVQYVNATILQRKTIVQLYCAKLICCL